MLWSKCWRLPKIFTMNPNPIERNTEKLDPLEGDFS